MSSNDDDFLDPDISIVIIPGPPKRHLVEPDLAEPEYYALGYVTAQWAYLEHALFVRTILAADEAEQPLPADAESMAFKRRLASFRLLLSQHSSQISHAELLLKLVGKIANLQDSRHKITHGIWSYARGDAKTIVAKSFRPRVEFKKPFDLDKIIELGHKIGEVNFHLTFPDGDFFPKGEGPFVHIHRSLLLSEEDRRRLYPRSPIKASPFVPLKKKKDE